MYRRYNQSPNQPQKHSQGHHPQPLPPQKSHQCTPSASQGSGSNHSEPKLSPPTTAPKHCGQKEPPPKPPKKKPLPSKNILLDFIPKNIFNPESKKILGFFTSEDLLLIALIFLFLESNDEDNPLMVLALVYVLLADYIDFDNLGDFAF